MASNNRESGTQLTQELFNDSWRFSLIQAHRLLTLLIAENNEDLSLEEIHNRIKVRPDLNLEFPNADLSQIEASAAESDNYQITATFLGLYGTSSPLPTFYTEALLKEQSEDKSLSREFIDIFNNHLYQLYLKIWQKHRLSYQIFEAKNNNYLNYLYALGGLASPTARQLIPSDYNLLRYLGIMNQFTRSALGLQTLLRNLLDIENINIVECITSKVPIPLDQQFSLGMANNQLGESIHIGDFVISTSHAFAVQIGPISYSEHQEFLPTAPKFQLLNRAIILYIDQPLAWEIEIEIISQAISSIGLGVSTHHHQLGYDTWLLAANAPVANSYHIKYNAEFIAKLIA